MSTIELYFFILVSFLQQSTLFPESSFTVTSLRIFVHFIKKKKLTEQRFYFEDLKNKSVINSNFSQKYSQPIYITTTNRSVVFPTNYHEKRIVYPALL